MTPGPDLPAARWSRLVDDEQGRVVVELDDAVAEGAPWPQLPVQLVVTVPVADPDPQGQPAGQEQAALARWRGALVRALGADGRLVATITAAGVREHVAYVARASVVQAWQQAPPRGLGTRDAQVALVPDPTWLGLREIAGLLEDGEQPLVLPL